MPRSSSDSPGRRDFLKKTSLGALTGILARGEEIPAAEEPRRTGAANRETMTCAVIGYGLWGREIASTLLRNEDAALVAVCDNFPTMLRRAERSLPGIATYLDYKKVLDDEDIAAVFIATPSHLHRKIVIDALAAGKHVYCAAPLASNIDDARSIARAARDAHGQIFQGGLNFRTEPQYQSVFGFIRSGALGKIVMARSQYHVKDSWRRASATSTRTESLNWRLDPALSAGLMGEIGIQQFDTTIWIIGKLPTAVTGFGNVMFWRDGREVPDVVQSVLEFPSGEHMIYDISLVSSFDSKYETFYGSDSTIILRDSKAWMFKEVDAPMLGWEVYARRDQFYTETGIALLANATKLDALSQKATDVDPDAETPLFHALRAFTDNYIFGPYDAAANWKTSFEATVVAIKANESVLGRKRIEFEPEWFAV